MTKNILVLRVVTAFVLAVVSIPFYVAGMLKLMELIKR